MQAFAGREDGWVQLRMANRELGQNIAAALEPG